jgi:type I restriction enzyme R subunit
MGRGAGLSARHEPQLAPGEPAAERDSFGEAVLVGRLREAIWRLNPAIPEEAREEALRKVNGGGSGSPACAKYPFAVNIRDLLGKTPGHGGEIIFIPQTPAYTAVNLRPGG